MGGGWLRRWLRGTSLTRRLGRSHNDGHPRSYGRDARTDQLIRSRKSLRLETSQTNALDKPVNREKDEWMPLGDTAKHAALMA